jgi:RNA polymerase sigma factor (sigma-70 family)
MTGGEKSARQGIGGNYILDVPRVARVSVMTSHNPTILIEHLYQRFSDLDGLTDGQLLDRFLSVREESAFEALVRRHGRLVLSVCRRVLRNSADADDAFQAVFLVLARRADSLRGHETVGNWLHGVAFRTALKLQARESARRTREQQHSPSFPSDPCADGERRELLQVLDEEVNQLPDRFRQAVVLCDLEGKTRHDAARLLGVPEGTLSGRLTTARRRLAGRLARRGIAAPAALLTAGLTAQVTLAAVPTSLVETAVHSASAVLTGSAMLPLAARANSLAQEVIRTMALTQRNRLVSLLIVLLTTAGMGTALHQLLANRAIPPRGPVPSPHVQPRQDVPQRMVKANVIDPTKIKPEFPDATIDLKADATQPAGVPVLVTVTLRNTGKKPLTYWCGGPGRYPGLFNTLVSIVDDKNNESISVLTNGQYMQGSGILESIPPGESATFPAMLQWVRAGKYTIRVGDGKPARVTVKDDPELLKRWKEDLLKRVRQGEPIAQHVARAALSSALGEALLEDLLSEDEKHAEQAAFTLVMADTLPPKIDAVLRKAMTKQLAELNRRQVQNTGAVVYIAMMAGKIATDDALEAVLELARSDVRGETRCQAVGCLGSFKQPKAHKALAGFLKDEDERVRLRSAQMLAERKDASALPVLLAIAGNAQSEWRRETLRSLLFFPRDPRVEPTLRQLQQDANESVRAEAVRILEELKGKQKRD